MVINYHIQHNLDSIKLIQKNIKDYTEKNEKAERVLTKVLDKIKNFKAILSNKEAAISKIEQYIEIIFTYPKFTFKFENEKYKIYRDNNMEAKNLSEGEKTVVAFSYFLATLEEQNFLLKDSIVVIDDPISSLDQNYLYNLLSLLYRSFSDESKFNKLYVLTHNFYFFKKLREILKNKTKNREDKLKFYEIKIKNNSSVLINAPKCIKEFSSEYLQEIEKLKGWYKEENLQENESIGIAIRKVFEIFLSYNAPYATSTFEKFNEVFKKAKASYRYLEGIANASCHTDEIDDLDISPAFRLLVGKDEIKQLFNFIRDIDSQHAEALNLPNELAQELPLDI